MKLLSLFISGALFSVGLIISGMHDPAVVLGFLDPFGDWNPALAFVMAGAVFVTLIGYRVVLKRPSPFFSEGFSVPTRTDIDIKLIAGAVMFGVGWGLVGLCPGPALVSIASDVGATLPFFLAMLAGMALPKWLTSIRSTGY